MSTQRSNNVDLKKNKVTPMLLNGKDKSQKKYDSNNQTSLFWPERNKDIDNNHLFWDVGNRKAQILLSR